ncbi:WYL domain-containing protein [Blastopirellula sp. JC732]|uniref:WYL domain-containing protein n=1 Tax=Blastopirellula sediminis TaxID=2894196 RepID=A0A9X1SJ08_9BACT|nr:WYL domain-containing protein [Blastopirellula sediminis]MCC9608619.1 WYL domain-containing protein [Blastopirellula sediminis]MCC9628604.1 WYL domain-containing protein [Blastopirellula sediminis]
MLPKSTDLLGHTDRDRRIRQADRLARILSVLRLIQTRGQWNAKAIAQELEVAERTIYRDLQALEFAGVPWFYDADAQSYRVRSDYHFPVPNLTEEEIIGQAVATILSETTGLGVVGKASSATQKIAATASEEVQQLLTDVGGVISVLGLQLAEHRHSEESIQGIRQALLRKRQLKGRYVSPYESSAVELALDPIRLCLVKNAWYLIGRPVESEELRTYRVARFESVEVMDAAANIPTDFDLKAYFGNAWAVYRGSQAYKVAVRFLPEAARIVTETNWHHTQKVIPQEDESVLLTFQVDGLQEICSWLLGWTGRVEVIEPPELRTMLLDRSKAGMELNQENVSVH